MLKEGKIMLVSIQGIFRNGVAKPAQPISGREGQRVIITFLDAGPAASASDGAKLDSENASYAEKDDWDKMIDCYSIDTGIPDFAEQHDHYIHGTPKKKRRPT